MHNTIRVPLSTTVSLSLLNQHLRCRSRCHPNAKFIHISRHQVTLTGRMNTLATNSATKNAAEKYKATAIPALRKKEEKKGKKKRQKTYNSRCSLVVTDPTTNLPVGSLSMGERTGSRIFYRLWSYVPEID